MADESPSEQGKLPNDEGPIDRATAAQMTLDLVCQTMVAAPPRTWIQSANHPGSRRWLVTSLAGVSHLIGRPLPAPAGNTRRAAAISGLETLTKQLRASGAWSRAGSEARDALADLLAATSAPFPVTVERIARSGALPFSQREITRVQRRSHPVT